MSETVIFIVGVVVFAITVWGTVMAGSLALMQAEIDQNPYLDADPDGDDGDENRPRLRGEY